MAIVRRKAKDGRTRYQVRIAVVDPATGKEGKRTVGTFRTVKEAERAEREALLERDSGTLRTPTRMTTGELLDEWVRVELPRRVKSENRQAYEVVVSKHLQPRFGDVPVKALTTRMVESFYADLLDQGKSTSLIRKCHMRLNSALQMAQRWGMIAKVPTAAAKVPSVRYKQGEVWTRDEVERFLPASEGDSMTPIWRLAVESGARTSELLGVRWADFDAGGGTIRFGRQVVRLDHGRPVIREGGKTTAAERTIRITPELVEALKAHRRVQAERRLAATEWINNELIFCTRTGRPYNAAQFRRSFNGLVEDAGVRNIGPHGMRRTAITLAIGAGANVKAVSGMVGHRDVATTIGIYQRLTKGMDDQLHGIMAGIVGSTSAGDDAPIATDARGD